jgi:hypothetical protein
MKKVAKIKKLKLSRETLRELENSDARRVFGGNQDTSNQSQDFGTCCNPSTKPGC